MKQLVNLIVCSLLSMVVGAIGYQILLQEYCGVRVLVTKDSKDAEQ